MTMKRSIDILDLVASITVAEPGAATAQCDASRNCANIAELLLPVQSAG